MRGMGKGQGGGEGLRRGCCRWNNGRRRGSASDVGEKTTTNEGWGNAVCEGMKDDLRFIEECMDGLLLAFAEFGGVHADKVWCRNGCKGSWWRKRLGQGTTSCIINICVEICAGRQHGVSMAWRWKCPLSIGDTCQPYIQNLTIQS